jgi:hypothetical protein
MATLSLRLRLGATASVLALACGGDGGETFDPEASAALAGSWSVELVATRPLLGRDSGAVATGALVLLANLPQSAIDGAVPSDYGAHAIDTRPLGFDLLAGGGFPSVVATLGPRDTVSMRLVPRHAGRGFEIRGRLVDGVIRGEWMLDGRTGGAAGTAVLRRARLPTSPTTATGRS